MKMEIISWDPTIWIWQSGSAEPAATTGNTSARSLSPWTSPPPLYWWKEYDTYKVATVANSTSTMHKIHSRPFSIDDFSHDHMTPETLAFMETVVGRLEAIRLKYMEEGKNKEDWYDMIQLLPSSYNQMRTCTMNTRP